MEIVKLKIKDLQTNIGQIPDLPMNPREWTQADVDRLAASLRETPELFEARPVLVVPQGKKYVILGGNMRYEASKKNGESEIPAIIFPADTPTAKLKELVIKDNGNFGNWSFDALANEWDDLPLTDWGVPAWKEEKDEEDELLPNDFGEENIDIDKGEKEEYVEQMLNDAMRENVRETIEQIDYMMKRGWISSFVTKGMAQAKFIRAKYYGEKYPQWISLYFCPQRFQTSASSVSLYEQMQSIVAGKDSGIAGLRTLSADGCLIAVLNKGSYPIGGARLPLDFPANKAQELIKEFAPKGKVLDPCHGWGGRLVGALLADASLYYGVDPSEEAHRGVEEQAKAFALYAKETKVQLLQAPFEDVDLQGMQFDMALTSPPYFDVEQYHGDGQAHIRYPEYGKWVEGFYKPLIVKTYNALKAGGVFVLQVGSQTYPLLQDGKRIAESAGFRVEDVRPFGGGTSSGLYGNTDEDETNEKIIILRKK